MRMQPEILIRRAVFDELPAIRDAHEDAIQSLGTRFYNEEIMQKWGRNRPIEPYIESFQNGDVYFIAIAEQGGQVLGYSCYSFKDEKHWLQRLFIRGGQQSQGLGTRLFREVEAIVRQAQAKELFVTGTLSGQRFYDAMGFILIENTKSPVGRRDDLFMDCVVMKKAL